MSTYAKNIHYLKEAIFAKLNDDATLRGLLGGVGRIFHRQPPSAAKYPCIVYYVLTDKDNPFNETQDTGGKITETYFKVVIFSKSSKTEKADNIESRIKILLHGQTTLDTAKIICYSCFRDNLEEPIKNLKTLVWATPVRYKTRWANK